MLLLSLFNSSYSNIFPSASFRSVMSVSKMSKAGLPSQVMVLALLSTHLMLPSLSISLKAWYLGISSRVALT